VTTDRNDWLTVRFEENRPRLRAVAYSVVGSLTDADDAVQEAWLRLRRSDASAIENVAGWLTTVVARVCLNMLQARRSRPEEPVGLHSPEPIVVVHSADPEHETLLADALGLALLVVMDTLTPAERLAFVLHDMFAVPFDEIASIVERSPTAARQLASRARRRVQGATPNATVDLARQREVVGAFLAASRSGDFQALLALLDPDVVLRADRPAPPAATRLEVRGASAVAGQVLRFSRRAAIPRPALVNGTPGAVAVRDGRPVSVAGFVISNGKIVEIDIVSDPARLNRLDLTPLHQ